MTMLRLLTGEIRVFTSIDDSSACLKHEGELPLQTISLVVGCRVMLIKNLDVVQKLVNGSVGVVIHFGESGFPVVQFQLLSGNTVSREITPQWFTATDASGQILASRLQVRQHLKGIINSPLMQESDTIDFRLGDFYP
jgi:hypothetical protein